MSFYTQLNTFYLLNFTLKKEVINLHYTNMLLKIIIIIAKLIALIQNIILNPKIF
jgi:hypothetical protein